MAKPMGMMSGCYFIGRGELLNWLKDLLSINYEKIEQTSNGAAYCQIIDAIHPGTVNLGRVNYNANQGFEMTQNYKVLQDAFKKNHITQYIDVLTLTKGKYMAALEMLQWMHGYYQQTGPHGEYDAVARRREVKIADPAPLEKDPTKKTSGFPTSKPTIALKHNDEPVGKVGNHVVSKKSVSKPGAAKPKRTEAESEKDKKIAELQHKCDEMASKLAWIQQYCHENEDAEVLQPILDLLE